MERIRIFQYSSCTVLNSYKLYIGLLDRYGNGHINLCGSYMAQNTYMVQNDATKRTLVAVSTQILITRHVTQRDWQRKTVTHDCRLQ